MHGRIKVRSIFRFFGLDGSDEICPHLLIGVFVELGFPEIDINRLIRSDVAKRSMSYDMFFDWLFSVSDAELPYIKGESLRCFVSRVLRAWDGVSPTAIAVNPLREDIFKISSSAADPPIVLLKTSGDAPCDAERAHAAQEVCADAGLAPREMAYDDDEGWVISSWIAEGEVCGQSFFVADGTCRGCEEFGRHLARLHMLPTEWYAPFRDELRARLPVLAGVPDGADVWSTTPGDFIEEVMSWPPQCQELWASNPFDFTPSSPASSHLALCHGDIGAGNSVAVGSGRILVVNFDMATVNHAVWDLAWTLVLLTRYPLTFEQQRSFFRAYLETMGYSASPADVDAVHFDAQMYAPYILQRMCCPWWLFKSGADYAEVCRRIAYIRRLLGAVRAEEGLDGPLHREVITSGIFMWATGDESIINPSLEAAIAKS